MNKGREKRNKKLRNLIALCSLIAIVLSVSTYAWFIGMKTVSVNSFDIKIATTEGLYLSMDGANWYYEMDAKNTEAYTGNANTWADGPDEGLIPMSTIGDMDPTYSRMKIFEKASLTVTPGGYRFLASQVKNNTTRVENSIEYKEGEGYVAFDLFVKNLSGNEYYANNNVLNEEAIYLTTNSNVVVGTGGVTDTGIENSVRVAFVQLGRVIGTTENADLITKITCSDTYSTNVTEDQNDSTRIVTGICRNAQIWEPNETKHVSNAIQWYETSCLKRKAPSGSETDNDVTATASYESTSCNDASVTPVINGIPSPTYAVSRRIDVEDNVNIYDGEFNKYTKKTITYEDYYGAGKTDADRADYALVKFNTFTDEEKSKAGNQRPEFMTLAPNSITKLRVYVYIEGQDVDNYDFAQLGQVIRVNFGFTKERYTEGNINYTGPSTAITPTGTNPAITSGVNAHASTSAHYTTTKAPTTATTVAGD